ncbi:MAG: hydroxyacid dehydrogenase [Chloroflexota bacterium]
MAAQAAEAVRIVIPDDFPPVYQGHPQLERLRTLGHVQVYGTRAASPEELLARLEGAQIVLNVRAYSVFDRWLLDRLPELRLISILGTGTDNVDLEAATELGVLVCNTPGASTVSVAELTMALILATARHVALSDRKVRGGEWYHREGFELRGKTLGVLGLGLIGQEVARLGKAFGMRVLAWSFTYDEQRAAECGAQLADFHDVLRQADVLSLHLRSSPRTRGIIGRMELQLMKPGAILVNTARGALVDEEALAEALRAGRLAGAGLDVYVQEPLPPESPLIQLDNVVLTPHIGWVTREASECLARTPVENIEAYLAGHPQHVVNPDVLARARPRPQ